MNAAVGSTFTCNICGAAGIFDPSGDWREAPSCATCASSVRSRHVAHCIAVAATGSARPLPDIDRRDVVGIGLSDAEHLARQLSRAFDYTNTFYHADPVLDVCDPPRDRLGCADFLVSSDVFEHVPTPVAAAFAGAFALLKPGGALVLTVPCDDRESTTEHFPNIREFAVTKVGDEWVIVGRTASGALEAHRDLLFHGGPGSTVEMRFFSRADVVAHLERAGFVSIEVHGAAVPRYGIYPPHDQGLPITARKPG